MIGRRFPDDPIKAICIIGTTWEHLHDTNGFVYAPTPTDIMEYLQIQVGVFGFWWVLTPPLGDGLWHLSLFIAPEEVRLRFEGESAEDVCLKALFQKPE